MSRRQEELAALAREQIREALKRAPPIAPEVNARLVWGTFFEGTSLTFEIYLPGERPEDANVLASVTIDTRTGGPAPVQLNEGFYEALKSSDDGTIGHQPNARRSPDGPSSVGPDGPPSSGRR